MLDPVRSGSGMAFRRRPGDEGAPTVVLVHGIPGAGAAWGPTVSLLPPAAQLIVPDLVGFGGSPVPERFTVDELGPGPQSRALERLLDELETGPVVLVGHDFGGPVSVLLAARRPELVSSLFVLAANTFPDTPIPFPLSLATMPGVGRVASRALFSRVSLALMLRQGVVAGPSPDTATYLGPRSQTRAIAAIFSGALQRLDELYTPVESALRSLDVPVVVGWGDRDPFFPLTQGERTAEASGGELRVLRGAGHFLPHERPTELADEIEALIADHG